MPALRSWLPRLAIAAGAVVLALLLAGYIVLLQTVPSPSGRLQIAALERPVEIVRDREGIPHVFAQTTADAMVALGFVHAQDRLWQMEASRRFVQGRLSELLGRATLDTDVLMRTFDLDGHARRSLDRLPAEARTNLEHYAKGVNAFLERQTGLVEPRWPPEFLVLRHAPEPWHAADSIAVMKLLALTLSNNVSHELRRLRLAALGMTSAEINDLMPGAEADGAPPLPDLAALLPLQQHASAGTTTKTALVDDILGMGASNNWVVSGSRTATGKSLLANDPHLRLAVPSIWYFAHLAIGTGDTPDFESVGATVPGAPVVVLGRTRHVAWGFTNTGIDVQDLFVEKLNPDNPAEYLTPAGWRRFEEHPVTIRVRGAPDHTFLRRATRHGPVMPDKWRDIGALLRPGHVAALAWTALVDDDTTIATGLLDGEVRTAEEFIARQRLYVVPMQSMVVADTAGTIALIAPGRVPIRDPANALAGRAPAPGWDARYDWRGFVPFERLPRSVDPASGLIATANARIVSRDYPDHLTFDWEAPWRQRRIGEVLAGRERLGIADMRAAQLDVVSLATLPLKGLMIDAARPLAGHEARTLDQLAAWDATMAAGLSEPLIFEAWRRESVRALLQDDLGAAFERFWDPHADTLIRILEGKAQGRDWCDDRSTREHETCGAVLSRALAKALGELTWQHGPDRSRWRWGDVHRADGEHRLFAAIPGLAALTSITPETPGGHYTLNRGSTDYGSERPFANVSAASLRAIYDLSDLNRSRFIHSTGQSGNPLSPGYRSFADRWARGQDLEIPTGRAEIEQQASGVWRLEPRQR